MIASFVGLSITILLTDAFFNSPDYNGRINVVNNFNKAINLNNDDGNKFILVVGTEKPNIGDVQAINKGYEIRVMCFLKSNKQGNSLSSLIWLGS